MTTRGEIGVIPSYFITEHKVKIEFYIKLTPYSIKISAFITYPMITYRYERRRIGWFWINWPILRIEKVTKSFGELTYSGESYYFPYYKELM